MQYIQKKVTHSNECMWAWEVGTQCLRFKISVCNGKVQGTENFPQTSYALFVAQIEHAEPELFCLESQPHDPDSLALAQSKYILKIFFKDANISWEKKNKIGEGNIATNLIIIKHQNFLKEDQHC